MHYESVVIAIAHRIYSAFSLQYALAHILFIIGFTTKYNENSKGDGTVTIFSGTGGGAFFFIALCCIAVCCYFYFCKGSSSSPSNAPTRSYSPRQSSPTPEVSHYSLDPPSYSPRTNQQAGQLVVAKAILIARL